MRSFTFHLMLLESGDLRATLVDLTYKISALIQSRKFILEAIARTGIEPSLAIAMNREEQMLPLMLAIRNPKLIRYVGTDAASCLETARNKPIGVLICTDVLEEGDGFQLCQSIKTVSPTTKTLLMCTGHQIDQRAFAADEIDGIFCYQELIEARGVLGASILAASGGRRYRSQRIRDISEKASTYDLKDRDYDVLHCLADGMSNRDISEALQISEQTAKTYTKRLIGNLSAKNRLHALILGLRYGLTSVR